MDPLLALGPGEFEDLVADYLRDRSYAEVRHVTGVSDVGIDFFCNDEHGRRMIVGCVRSRPGAKVGLPVIRRFCGLVVHARAARGMVVTTADFTAPAKTLAREHDIELIAGTAMRAFHDRRVGECRGVGARAGAVHAPPVQPGRTIRGASVWWYVAATFVAWFLLRAFV